MAWNQQKISPSSMEKGTITVIFRQDTFNPRKNLSVIKAEELVSDMMSHITLRSCRCCCIVLNRHAPNNSDDGKDNFYEEMGRYSIISLHTI